MYGESNMETYITIWKIDSRLEFAVWLRELKQGLCINLEGWDGEGGGREVQEGGDICTPVADSCWGLTENTKFYKEIILQLKSIIFKKWIKKYKNKQKKKGETRTHSLPPEDPVRRQGLQTRKRVRTGYRGCWHRGLGLPSLQKPQGWMCPKSPSRWDFAAWAERVGAKWPLHFALLQRWLHSVQHVFTEPMRCK